MSDTFFFDQQNMSDSKESVFGEIFILMADGSAESKMFQSPFKCMLLKEMNY